MTNQPKTDWLETILATVRDAGAEDDNHGAEDWTYSDSQIDRAAQAIRTQLKERLLADVIGEDEKMTTAEADGKNEDTNVIISGYMKSSRNWLRDKQRTALTQVLGEDV